MFQLWGLLLLIHFWQWMSWAGCSSSSYVCSLEHPQVTNEFAELPQVKLCGSFCPKSCLKRGLASSWTHSTRSATAQEVKITWSGQMNKFTVNKWKSLLSSAYKNVLREGAGERGHFNEREAAVGLQGFVYSGCSDLCPWNTPMCITVSYGLSGLLWKSSKWQSSGGNKGSTK